MLYDVYDSVKRQIMENVSADTVKSLGIDVRGKKKFPVRQKSINGLTYRYIHIRNIKDQSYQRRQLSLLMYLRLSLRVVADLVFV